MKSKYIPEKYAGRELGLGGRLVGLVGGSLLVSTSPLYLISKAIEKGKQLITGEYGITPSMDEFTDTLKICYEVFLRGKIPLKEE